MQQTTTRSILLVAIIAILSACQYTLVQAGQRQAGAFSVNTTIAWNLASSTEVPRIEGKVWTANGLLLDRLIFFSGIEDGKSLFRARSEKDPFPIYNSDMLPYEVMEFVVDSLTKFMAQESVVVQANNLAPQQFGETQGFRFDFSYTDAYGLPSKGIAASAIQNEKLYMILFSATEIHYYQKYVAEVESIINSARFSDNQH